MVKLISYCMGLILFCSFSQAAELGSPLAELSFSTTPNDFSYKANGQRQVITVYPAKIESLKNSEFNQRLQDKGICPLAITDIKNKAWYAPVSMVEKEMNKQLKEKRHRSDCILSGDYEGLAVTTWGLELHPATLVVDEQGLLLYLFYGALNEIEIQKVFALLQLPADILVTD